MRQIIRIGCRALLVSAVSLVAAQCANAAATFNSRPAYDLAAGPATSNENFSSFATDVSFQTSPVVCAGFSIQQEGINAAFRNNIDVVPTTFTDNNGTANASCFTDADAPGTMVRITFPSAVLAFGADFYGIEGATAGAEGLVAEAFNGASIISTYNFPDLPGITTMQFFGVVAGAGEQITSVRLRSRLVVAGVIGEGFGMDDVTINANVPEPTGFLPVLAATVAAARRRRAR